MKKLFLSFVLLIFISLTLMFSSTSNAQVMGQGMMGFGEDEIGESEHKTLDEVIPEMLTKYNVSSIKELNCNEINDKDFEVVGDAFMESAHPGKAHEVMDEMMGGEGSESLRTAHINMGKGYLGCSQFGFQNMIGGSVANMMGWGYQGAVMGNYGFGILGAIIIWIVVLIDLVLLGIWLWKQINKK